MHDRREQVDLGALVITIEEEGQGLAELEQLMTRQADLLVAAKPRPLIDNLNHQEKLLRRLGKLEEQRLRLLEELVELGQLLAPPSRLEELARALPEPERARVRELSRVLGERVQRVRRLERRNRQMIESGRRCLDGFLRLLIAPERPATYGQRREFAAEPRFFSSAA